MNRTLTSRSENKRGRTGYEDPTTLDRWLGNAESRRIPTPAANAGAGSGRALLGEPVRGSELGDPDGGGAHLPTGVRRGVAASGAAHRVARGLLRVDRLHG